MHFYAFRFLYMKSMEMVLALALLMANVVPVDASFCTSLSVGSAEVCIIDSL